MPRLVGWLMGLLLYGVASGLKIVGFNLGPFTVLASVFTTLLVFNLGFAHWLLHESITRDKVASSCLVLLGAVISTAGTPSGVPTQFTPAEVQALLDSGGRIYLGAALTIIAASLVLIVFFELRYRGCCAPAPPEAAAHPRPPPPPALVAPRWLTGLMVFLYPGALGLDESVADCGVRAATAMLGSGVAPWGEGVFWLMLGIGVTCACATSVTTPRST